MNSSREELIRALEIAEHGMARLHGLTYYDAVTEESRRLEHHYRMDFSTEIETSARFLKEAGGKAN